MSVIVSRALPDVRDGLKPVHRRILYSMYEQGLRPDRPRTKCAKAVGEVMGNFHPHGDTAIYDALARMAQDFSLRHLLIDGHGNFGGRGPEEGPAAMRYTECRLAALAMEMLAGIDQDTIDFVPNYDGTTEEPVVLPARFPNLLVNGSQGIAVGMATNIPPHNLGEVIDAVGHVLEHPDATPDDLMAFVKGPDFPTGAQILGRQGILDAYRTGKGSIKMRAVAEVDESRGSTRIVVTDIPFQTSVEVIEQKIGDARANAGGASTGISDGAERLRRQDAAPRGHLEARRQRERRAQQPLQAHAATDELPGEHGGARRRGAPHAQPGPGGVVLRPVAHQIEVAHAGASEFRLNKAREAFPHRRGAPQGHRHARRRHRRHPGVRGPSRGPRRAHGRAVLLQRAAVRAHPRHDPGPWLDPTPGRAEPRGGGDGADCARRSPSFESILADQPACTARRDRRAELGRDPGQVRQGRPRAHRGHPRPRRARGWRDLHQRRGRSSSPTMDAGPATSRPSRPVRSAPRAGVGAACRGRVSKKRTSSTTWCTPRAWRTSCCSPTAGASTASGRTRCP